MQCLFCGKGIGPLRQLRDLEFCSDAHRTRFAERYKQRLYEALAPEPAPAPPAGFLERPAEESGPCLSGCAGVLPRPLPGEILPALNVFAAGVFLDSAGWIGESLAGMPARPWWSASAVAAAIRESAAPFRVSILPPGQGEAGTVAAEVTPLTRPARPASARRCPGPDRAPAVPTFQTSAHPAGILQHADLSMPRLRAAAPHGGEPAAIGPVAPAGGAPHAPEVSAAVAIAAPPASRGAADESGLAPAAIVSCPRPQEAARLHVDTAAQGVVSLPAPAVPETSTRLPAAGAHTALTAASPSPREPQVSGEVPSISRPALLDAQPSLVGLAPRSRPADPLPQAAAVARVARRGARTPAVLSPAVPLVETSLPRPELAAVRGGTPAEWLRSGSETVRQAAGSRELRFSAEPAPVQQQTLEARPAWNALPGELAYAPPSSAPVPECVPPAAASPVWNPAVSAPVDRTLVPKAGASLPPIVSVAALAGAIGRPGGALAPGAGRAVRACASLSPLPPARVSVPVFNLQPVRARFNEMVRGAGSAFYSRDAHAGKKQNNLRPFPRTAPNAGRRLKWQYIGAAAAALLLAGLLRPVMRRSSDARPSSRQAASLRQWMTDRATRSFEDDFRGGLNQWKSVQARLPQNWAYSPDGFIHPGQLAIYRPSVPLSDYRFEFMAQIENKSVDWVVRAHDAENYYAVKFTVVKPGPRPLVAMVRYPVVEGERGARVQTPVRMMIHANRPYRVTVDVKGNRYRTFIEGQEADFWTEDRLKTGGVGFFSEAGERARVYWVKLESHGDWLGRICGLLSGKDGQGQTDKEKQANGLPALWIPGRRRLWAEWRGIGRQESRGDADQPRVVACRIVTSGWQAGRSRA